MFKIIRHVCLLLLFLIGMNTALAEEQIEKENIGIRPHGAPIIKYSSDYGLQGGAHVAIFNYGDGTIKPYKYLYRLQGLIGVNKDTNNYFSFDAPEIFGSKFRIQSRMAFEMLHRYNYFGVGNSSPKGDDSDFNKFKRTTPSVFINVIRNISGKFFLIGGYLYENRFVNKAPDSKLAMEAPVGSTGGIDSELRLGVAYDSRNEEAMPTKGTFTDFYVELPQKWIGSSYNYTRFTFTNRNFVKISSRLVWASRFVVKSSVGDVPFYEMAKVGGYYHTNGLGGGTTIRGILQSRVIDKNMYMFNEELRLYITNFYIMKERLDIYMLSFADLGRVFNGVRDLSFSNMHLGAGAGARICWNKNFVLAPDFGLSSEGYGVYLSFRNMF